MTDIQRTIGILGGGQLGRMFCHAAQQLGFKTTVLDADNTSPAGLIAHEHIQAAYDDLTALKQLAQHCEAITTEFENVPADSLAYLATITPVYPSHTAVRVCQDRTLEKQWFADCQIACAPNVTLTQAQDCLTVSSDLFPAILKTAQMGYDGKGQITVHTHHDLLLAFKQLGSVRCVLEKKLPLAYEISVIVARSTDGVVVNLPVQQNNHVGGVLALTQVPAPNISAEQTKQAIDAATMIAQRLEYVGVLCVEFFILQDGSLVANELAPRPHNSGHYSIEACDINQFQLQVRTVTGLPLIQPRQIQAAVMVNILGDIWFNSPDNDAVCEPNWTSILNISGVHLHLYGKTTPKIGRKMGHITVTADTLEHAQVKAKQCCEYLGLQHYFIKK
jgi:5-(carboxyamino)imidazole ribonucleotide synthase